MAFAIVLLHVFEVAPKDKLITFAGFGLFGTPLTGAPDAQIIAEATSLNNPPHRPNTLTGKIFALYACHL